MYSVSFKITYLHLCKVCIQSEALSQLFSQQCTVTIRVQIHVRKVVIKSCNLSGKANNTKQKQDCYCCMWPSAGRFLNPSFTSLKTTVKCQYTCKVNGPLFYFALPCSNLAVHFKVCIYTVGPVLLKNFSVNQQMRCIYL